MNFDDQNISNMNARYTEESNSGGSAEDSNNHANQQTQSNNADL